jgi:hypothetical protein
MFGSARFAMPIIWLNMMATKIDVLEALQVRGSDAKYARFQHAHCWRRYDA